MQIKDLVKHTMRERVGPSFDRRMEAAVARKQQEMRELEREQRARIMEARENGMKKSQNASPIAEFIRAGEAPNSEKQAQILEHRRKKMAEQSQAYRRQKEALQERLRNREPLFRISDVSAAQKQLQEKAQKRKMELLADEQKRWQHIEEINRKVLEKPLLMQHSGGMF